MRSNMRNLGLALIVAVASGVLVPSPVQAVNAFHEDFTTSVLQDPFLTDLNWSIADGEIRLSPFSMTEILYWNTTGNCRDITISGGYAYLADYAEGLRILDTTNPYLPFVVGRFDSPGYVTAVAVQGDYAYLADAHLGLKVVDITDPTSPTLISSLDSTTGSTQDIVVDGNLVYLACYTDGFQVLDVSDPVNPVHIDSFNGLSSVNGLDLEGDLLYVTDNNTGLWIFDVSDPLTITMVGWYDGPGDSRQVFVDGNRAYLADHSILVVLDVTDPTAPTLLGTKATGGLIGDVVVVGEYAYVADFNRGLALMDVSDPAAIEEITVTSMATGAVRVAVSGDVAYAAAGTNGLMSFRASASIPLDLFGGNDFPFGFQEPVVEGHLTFVPCVVNGMMIYDLSDPANLTHVGAFREDGVSYTTLALAVKGDYAFLADNNQGFLIVDISDPGNPFLVNQYAGSFQDIAIQGNTAYMVGSSFINAFDITDPTAISLMDDYTPSYSPSAVAVDGRYVYVAVYFGGVDVLEFNPITESFSLLGNLDTSYAVDVVINGDVLYVADSAAGLKVLDVSNPTLPSQIGSYVAQDQVRRLCLDGADLYLSQGAFGIQRVSVSDPASPQLLDTYNPGIQNFGVAVSGDYLVLGNQSNGLAVVTANQRNFDGGANHAGSTVFNTPGREIIQARVFTTAVEDVAWALSSNGGSVWEPMFGDGTWSTLSVPATELQWRSTHSVIDPRQNPSCSDLQIEWLYDIPEIATVSDVPGDQGLQISLAWQRSGFDHVGSAAPIIDYSVYRKIEGTVAQDAEKAYPPGDWHFVMTVPADAEDNYAVVVPTLGDSTITDGQHLSSFFVRARTATPGVYYDAAPVDGYSVDNLAPSVPAGLKMQAADLLAWDEITDADFRYFTVYGSEAIVLDATAVLVGNTTGLSLDVSGQTSKYLLVTATDFAGNESEPAILNQASGVGDGSLPSRFSLHANYPNPFNPTTVIRFDLPVDSPVRLRVFDVSGRVVRTLVDGRTMAAGRHDEIWGGIGDAGEPSAAGVYLYRIEAGDFTDTMRMTLIK
jgi:hypothetical protein